MPNMSSGVLVEQVYTGGSKYDCYYVDFSYDS